MIFAVLDPSALTLCINCSFFIFIKVRPHTAKLTNVIVTSFGESSNLVSESKMFVKDEAKVSSRVGGVE